MYARIENNEVVETIDFDPSGKFHPELKWVEFDGRKNVSEGWLYNADSGELSPPVIDISILADAKRNEIDAAAKAAIDVVRKNYPDYEQLSWDRQEREARNGGGPLIETMAKARDIPLEELIPKIINKVETYETFAGEIIGIKQRLDEQITIAEKSNDRETLERVEWVNT